MSSRTTDDELKALKSGVCAALKYGELILQTRHEAQKKKKVHRFFGAQPGKLVERKK